MNKKIVLAGGCFWGEKSLGGFSQEVASYFGEIATTCTASVRSNLV